MLFLDFILQRTKVKIIFLITEERQIPKEILNLLNKIIMQNLVALTIDYPQFSHELHNLVLREHEGEAFEDVENLNIRVAGFL